VGHKGAYRFVPQVENAFDHCPFFAFHHTGLFAFQQGKVQLFFGHLAFGLSFIKYSF
jgi:hypothetical protein